LIEISLNVNYLGGFPLTEHLVFITFSGISEQHELWGDQLANVYQFDFAQEL
jgi:hypothetical protein